MHCTDFLRHQAQTTSHAQGSYIYNSEGNTHLDFVAGVSVCTLGHSYPKVG